MWHLQWVESHFTKKNANCLNFHPIFPQVLKFHLWLCGLNFCRSAKSFTKNILSPCRLTKWQFYFELKVSLFPKLPRHSEFHCKISHYIKNPYQIYLRFLKKINDKSSPEKLYPWGQCPNLKKILAVDSIFVLNFFVFAFTDVLMLARLGFTGVLAYLLAYLSFTGVLTGVLELHWHTYWRTWDSLAYLSFTGVLGIHWRTAYLGFTGVLEFNWRTSSTPVKRSFEKFF